ncbi:MAG: AMP-binding protein [Propionibacteriaceae bacterium]|nr:AMP-binding protein [Propionibacteriaceae bacterium]
MVDIVGSTTFGDAWDATARANADHTFLVFLSATGQRTQYTYREFDLQVARAVRCFTARGISRGSIVAMQIRNSGEFIACLLGLAKMGAIAVPIGLGVTAAEVAGIYRTCQPGWAVVEAGNRDLHEGLRAVHGVLPGGLLIVHDQDCDPWEGSQPSEPEVRDEPGVDDAAVRSDDIAEIMFTSGTTAAPKGVMVTHANLVYSGHYAIWQASLRPDDRIFTTMPACHSNFQLVALTGTIMAGATLVLVEHYSARRFWADVRAEGATVIQLTAMLARTLLKQPVDPLDRDHRVREALYFMPLSDEDKDAFTSRFAVRLLNSYGSTESICWVVTDPPLGERRWPSVGRAGLGYEVAIVGPEGQPLPAGQVGEFRIKGVTGRTLMAGYYGDLEATRATLGEDGWMRTSDTGYMDADGWFYFVERACNLIKRAGENISACEVEAVLETHPLIKEAAVIGVPDPIRDQAVKAFILADPDCGLDAAAVEAYCRGRLAEFKVPHIIEFVTEFPRTPSMKIEKRSLS